MSQPHFYQPEKIEKFLRHWQHRLGLEALKARQAMESADINDPQQKKAQEAELSAYIESCYSYEKERKLAGVFVTDHKPVPKKYLTTNEEEDQDFYEYQQSVAAYNAGGAGEAALSGAATPRYEQGSLMQRIGDPFAGAPRDADGALVYTVGDAELTDRKLDNEEHMKEMYAQM